MERTAAKVDRPLFPSYDRALSQWSTETYA